MQTPRFFLLTALALAPTLALRAAPVKSNPISSTILQGKIASGLSKQCSRISPTGNFLVPPVSLVERHKLEATLPSLLQANSMKTKDYWFQFAAHIQGKQRLIYVNAFIPDSYSREHWKTTPIIVCDGGKAFWGAEYNVSSGKFQSLSFNGPA